MPFKKLNRALVDSMLEEGIDKPFAFQQMVLSKIKSGANVYGIAPDGSGKTIALVISVIQKLLTTKVENAPRALILVKDKESALALNELFSTFLIMMDLDAFCVFDSQHIYNQKDTIYYGVDIVIATPNRLYKLYTESGINLNVLKMVILEDAELLVNNFYMPDIIKITESIKNCQYLVFANKFIPRFDELKDHFMRRSQLVEYKPSE